MIDLSKRQRATLIAGLDLLRKKVKNGRGSAQVRGLPSLRSIAILDAILRSEPLRTAVAHQHPRAEKRSETYAIAGACTAHGAICIACEVHYEMSDGPLEWCRECERVLARAADLVRTADGTPRSTKRREAGRRVRN